MVQILLLPGLLGRVLLGLGCCLVLPASAGEPGSAAMEATPDSFATITSGDPGGQRAQHLFRLGVAPWHEAGFRGQGIKIAILDSGFRGYRAHLGHALPAHVTVHSFRGDGNLEAKNSQHGILCGEVIHALAPAAELYFANWEPDRPDQFLAAARWARQQGVKLLSCSLIMPSWSDGEGGGPIHAALTRLLGNASSAEGMLCFASAGNTALRHWSGLFHDGGQGWHEWQAGHPDNLVWPWSSEEVSVELCWKAGADYDLVVVDGKTTTPVAASPHGQDGRCCAVARFVPDIGHRYQVRVRLVQGTAGLFHLVALGGGLELTSSRGSIAFPADGPEVVAVGAVSSDGRREAYSSCGPNSLLPKPDLVAPVPFASFWRPRPFAGTSAAAPQATALAAVWWSRYPQATAAQVREALRMAARDLGPPGHDYETGYGLIRLP
jgi:subtilisin family serine protease